MKNLKKLLAVIVTVCVLATMTVPAFAAASDAEICEALDILRGDGAGVTDTYLAKGTERYQAAILYLRLIGKEDEAIAFTGEENFDDADLIYAGGQRILAYLKANPDLGWTGVGGNKFEPTNPASAQMIYKVLLEALGYKQDVDFTWAETLDFAAEKGLSEIADVAELTNADMAVAIVEALGATVKDSDATLAEKLVADGIIDEEAAAELGLVELVPATLEVVSVSADNLKEVVVVFNQPVDGDTVNKDNIKIDGQDADSVELKDDKVTVVITVAAADGLENQGDYKLVVSGVKSAAGVEIEKTEKTFKAFDATLPEAVSITITGPSSFTITFSEPIKGGGEVDVKAGNAVVGVDNDNLGTGKGRDVAVELFSDLEDGKEYEITVKKFVDYAEYQNVIKTFKLTYAKDASAPTATVEEVDQKYVVVKFNKPVTGLHENQFWHTFTAWKAMDIYKAAEFEEANKIDEDDSVEKVWVKFAEDADTGKPIAEGTTTFGIRGKATDEDGTSYEIKDNWDNKFEDAEFKVTVSADKTAPEVTELSVKSESSLKIVFSEDVKFEKENVEVYDTDGKAIDGVEISVTPEGTGKEFTIGLKENLKGQTIVVKIKNVEDTALQPNKLGTYTKTLTITDATAPEVTKVNINEILKNDDEVDKVIAYVFFNEPVDATAINKANYGILDKERKLTTISKDPAFYDSNKVVKLELTADEWKILDEEDGVGLFIKNIKDLNGNEMAGYVVSKDDFNDYKTDKPEVEKVEVVAADKVILTFNQYLKRVDKGAFKLQDSELAGMEKTEKDGKTVVTLKAKSDSKIAADLHDLEIVIDATKDSGNKILNIFDVNIIDDDDTQAITIYKTYQYDNKPAVVDKIAPSVDKDSSYVYSESDEIVLMYDEAIEANTVSTLTYEVEGFKVDEVEVSEEDKTVTITVSKDEFTGFEENAKVKVTQKYPVVGVDGNKSKFDSIEITVKDAPEETGDP